MKVDVDKLMALREAYLLKKFRHFKGGIYQITQIVLDADTCEYRIIYKNVDKPWLVWDRPFNDFFSEVDHEKYPDVTQKMRFQMIVEDVQF